MSTLWLGRWVQGHFPRLLKQILAWKRSTAMGEKGHQNRSLVIRSQYDPHLPFSRLSVSKPWSKRDTSSSVPPFQEMSVPHCPTAITSCEPGSPKQRHALSPEQCEGSKRNTTHIYEIIWHLMFHHNERKNCFSLAELKHVTPGNGLVLLLSCLSEFFWQGR